MKKFCSQCGNELKEGATFCGKCGNKIGENNKNQTNSSYEMVTGVIMIILGSILILGSLSLLSSFDTILMFLIPGIAGIAGGILNIKSIKDKELLKTAAIIFFVGAISNFVAIIDISLFTIGAVIIGIMNLTRK